MDRCERSFLEYLGGSKERDGPIGRDDSEGFIDVTSGILERDRVLLSSYREEIVICLVMP
jgi:hypothetical protein